MITRIARIEAIKKQPAAVLEAEVNGKVTATEALRWTGKGLVRLRTNAIESSPPLLLLKLPVKAGDKWEGEFEADGKKATYTAETREETVEVPAGKFKTMRVAIRLKEGEMVVYTTYWFVRGVGFVQQTVEAAGLNISIKLEKYKVQKKGK
jgi:hypothetical protein